MSKSIFSTLNNSYVFISPETRLMMLEVTKPNVYVLLNAALTSGRRVNGMQFRAITQDVE